MPINNTDQHSGPECVRSIFQCIIHSHYRIYIIAFLSNKYIKVHVDVRKVHVSEKQKILCNVYDIKSIMMYVAASRKVCRKISKFDYAPNPTWQVPKSENVSVADSEKGKVDGFICGRILIKE